MEWRYFNPGVPNASLVIFWPKLPEAVLEIRSSFSQRLSNGFVRSKLRFLGKRSLGQTSVNIHLAAGFDTTRALPTWPNVNANTPFAKVELGFAPSIHSVERPQNPTRQATRQRLLCILQRQSTQLQFPTSPTSASTTTIAQQALQHTAFAQVYGPFCKASALLVREF